MLNDASATDANIAAIHAFITSTKDPRKSSQPKPSSKDINQHEHVALQITHNLRCQHDWTELHIHHVMPGSPGRVLPCPIISGSQPSGFTFTPTSRWRSDRSSEVPAKRAGRTRNSSASASGCYPPICGSHGVQSASHRSSTRFRPFHRTIVRICHRGRLLGSSKDTRCN